MTTPATSAQLLAAGSRQLAAAGAGLTTTPSLDAALLLAAVLGVATTRLRSHPEEPVAAARARAYQALLARRLAGEPVAYLTGRREFWSFELAVDPGVLVPRPETELLVERALALLPQPHASVCDLGTGSGAIALALARERRQWRVLATDVSAAALAVARRNAAALGLTDVELREGDWYAPLGDERFDLLVSNPPYVAQDDPALAQLAHEPRLALTPGADALASLETLARGAPAHLNAGGWLILEHGATQGAAVRAALVLAGLRHVRSHPDLAGHERATEGQR